VAYADFDRVNTLLAGQLKKRIGKLLFTVCSEKADAVVNAFMGTIYDIPFTTTPALVQHLAEEITLYYLLRTGYFDGVAGNDKEVVDKMWDDAIAQLTMIVKGTMTLPDADPADEGGTMGAQIDSTTRIYHPWADIGDERDWVPDANMIEAIEAAKE
jgi:phage gp36-like protein